MSLNKTDSNISSLLLDKDENSALWFAAIVPKGSYTSVARYWIKIEDPAHDNERTLSRAVLDALYETLADPLLEDLWLVQLSDMHTWCKRWQDLGFRKFAEKQFLAGVTDNLAHVVEEALSLKIPDTKFQIASGRTYLSKELHKFDNSEYSLYHPLTERFIVHDLSAASNNSSFLCFPSVALNKPAHPLEVDLTVSDEELCEISRNRLLALTLDEMQTIRNYFNTASVQKARQQVGLPRSSTDVELEILAQTWSEHCKHKIFNATIKYTEQQEQGATKTETINSLYRSHIKAATAILSGMRPDLLSVFVDNSGVVKWDDHFAVCFKVETHNSPCALEPYGGALTGILGVNRDILGTGLGAKLIFNTDVLCFAHPESDLPKRPKLLPPEVIINGVRKGIEDGGNKSGIPTVNGAIVFDPGYRAKPLVFCGTGGVLPLSVNGLTGFGKHTQVGDTIVMAGGRVGKDGVHGATFSSEALHEGSPVTAVQIGDPFTQKRLIDFVLEARDSGLITGITDNGAGGLSSSVGEMAELTGGASIELDMVPTKYPGLSDWEIVISESQERMTISTSKFSQLKELALKHHVEVSAIGVFNTSGQFQVMRSDKLVAAIDLEFLHNGVPVLKLEAESKPVSISVNLGSAPQDLNSTLLRLLGHPNICNREVVIRQYDHEVQGMSVIKQLMGARQNAACDAAVITPILGSKLGLAISNGLCPRLSRWDAQLMAICAVDEAIRNAVCVGADPATLSLLDNFCWPDPIVTSSNPEGKALLGMLVKACQGLYQAVTIFEAPLISGKDSMKNNFDDGTLRLAVPPTLLISAMGKVHDIDKCISMDFKSAGDLIYLLSSGELGLAGSHYEEIMEWQSNQLCSLDLEAAKRLYRLLHKAIQDGWISSAHDLSEGGLAVALSECIIGSNLGANIVLAEAGAGDALLQPSMNNGDHSLSARSDWQLFGEGPGRIIVSVRPALKDKFESLFKSAATCLGETTGSATLNVREAQNTAPLICLSISDLERAWNTPLPFSKDMKL